MLSLVSKQHCALEDTNVSAFCCAAGSAVCGSPLRARALSGAPRLPNGSLPAAAMGAGAGASPAPSARSTLRLLDDISKACLEAELPGELLQDPEFAFLAPSGGAP
jgi:hypothetical protein